MKTQTILVFSFLSLAACGEAEPLASLPSARAPEARSAQEVRTARVGMSSLARIVTGAGSVQPMREADLAPHASARVLEIFVHEGDHVEEGQALVTLDATDARLRLAEARAAALSARARAEGDANELARLSPLAEEHAITARDLDRLRAAVRSSRAAADSAAAVVRQAERAADEHVVRAPFAGTVVSLPFEVGEMATTMPLSIVARVIDATSVEASVRIPERDLVQLAPGAHASARFAGIAEPIAGEVHRVGAELDPASRTGEVVLRFANPTGRLRPGMLADLEIEIGEARDAIAVPASAVMSDEGEHFVFVVEGGTARRRAVRAMALPDGRFEIAQGLEQGEEIVIEGGVAVRDGDAVEARAMLAGRIQS
jgi:RND family efflux transporter MFP subunit